MGAASSQLAGSKELQPHAQYIVPRRYVFGPCFMTALRVRDGYLTEKMGDRILNEWPRISSELSEQELDGQMLKTKADVSAAMMVEHFCSRSGRSNRLCGIARSSQNDYSRYVAEAILQCVTEKQNRTK